MKDLFKYRYLTFLVLAGLISSCEQDQIGPDTQSVGSGFKVKNVTFESTEENLNLKINQIPTIIANWGEDASYELTIKGLKSGAYKRYTGLDSKFEEDWIGLSSNIYFFQTGERASLHLKIAGVEQEIVSKDTITVKEKYNFDGKTRDGITYFVAETFEKGNQKSSHPIDFVSPDANDEDVFFTYTDNFAIQGDTCLMIGGNDANGNGWSGDILNRYPGTLLSKTGSYPIDSGINPSDLFFNLFVYGTGAEGTTIEFQVYEIDRDTIPLDTRKDINDWIIGGQEMESPINLAYNDVWIFDIPVKWEGWKLVSIPYSEFRAKSDMGKGGNGNRIRESFRICGLGLSILSYPIAGFETKAYVDFFTITTGGKANYN